MGNAKQLWDEASADAKLIAASNLAVAMAVLHSGPNAPNVADQQVIRSFQGILSLIEKLAAEK